MNKEMEKHTPGPWHVNEQTGGIYAIDGFEVCDPYEGPHTSEKWSVRPLGHWADKPGQHFIERTDDEMEANAALIASAPSLLSENKKLREALEKIATSTISNPEYYIAVAKQALTIK